MLFRYFLSAITGLTGLLLSATSHSQQQQPQQQQQQQQQQQPLWELGIGTGVLYLPYYRGADQSRRFAIPFPIIIYRGEYLSIDESGAHGHLFSSENINLELSLAGGVPVTSSSDSLRAGMPDLDPTVEIGPSLDVRLWQNNDQRRSFWLKLPMRAVFSINLEKTAYQGWTLSPFFEYIVKSPQRNKWKVGLSWGPLYANYQYHQYFYEVNTSYVTPSRSEYPARSGYGGHRVTFTLQKKKADLWLGAFIRYDNLNDAAFLDSPLVNSRNYLAAGVGFTWIFTKSNQYAHPVKQTKQ